MILGDVLNCGNYFRITTNNVYGNKAIVRNFVKNRKKYINFKDV